MIIIVEGPAAYGSHPLEYIADMLRYDDGEVLSLVRFSPEPDFIAIIKCSRYTPDRWTSFGLVSRESFYRAPKIVSASDYDEADEDWITGGECRVDGVRS